MAGLGGSCDAQRWRTRYRRAVSTLTRENVRAFVNRDWSLARTTKDLAIARTARRAGASAAFSLERALNDQVWPRLRRERNDRAELAALVRLTTRLRHAKP